MKFQEQAESITSMFFDRWFGAPACEFPVLFFEQGVHVAALTGVANWSAPNRRPSPAVEALLIALERTRDRGLSYRSYRGPESLAELGDPSVDARLTLARVPSMSGLLYRATEDAGEMERMSAAESRAVGELLNALQQVEDSRLRARIAVAVAGAGRHVAATIDTVEAIIEILEGPADPDLHRQSVEAAEVLVELGELSATLTRVVDVLFSALSVIEAHSQRTLVELTLGEFEWTEARVNSYEAWCLASLRRIKNDQQGLFRRCQQWCLASLRRIKNLPLGNPTSKAAGEMEEPPAPANGIVDSLLDTLQKDRNLRCRLARALGDLGPAAARVPWVMDALIGFLRQSDDGHLSKQAAEALGKLGLVGVRWFQYSDAIDESWIGLESWNGLLVKELQAGLVPPQEYELSYGVWT